MPTPAGAPIKNKDKDAEKMNPRTISRFKTSNESNVKDRKPKIIIDSAKKIYEINKMYLYDLINNMQRSEIVKIIIKDSNR